MKKKPIHKILLVSSLCVSSLVASGCSQKNPYAHTGNEYVIGAMQPQLAVNTQASPMAVDYNKYPTYTENSVKSVAQEPISTFSADVDTGSYTVMRSLLNRGTLPPSDSIRLEEWLNYFHYNYPKPVDNSPFSVVTEIAPTPWNAHSKLLRIAIKATDINATALPPANLVFLIDVSGSMSDEDKLPLVKNSLKLLVNKMRDQDKISIVIYSGETKTVLPPTSGKDKSDILSAINQLSAGGSTAGGSGIDLAYQMAEKGFIKNGINRIFLATDGDFNVGVTDTHQLEEKIKKKSKNGINLTTLGFGQGNYNDSLMMHIADVGNGNYAYIDSMQEAQKVLVEQLSSTMSVVANDLKLQVEFNPQQVKEYRLLGYEKRLLNQDDFSNDKVDAGDIGAGHTVTALYEIIPVGEKGWLEKSRYQHNTLSSDIKNNELALLRIRYKEPTLQKNKDADVSSEIRNDSKLIEIPLTKSQIKSSLSQASDDFRFASAVAALAQQLKNNGRYTGAFSIDDTINLARDAKGDDSLGLRAEFIQIANLAKNLSSTEK